jgi:midasin
MNLASQSVLEGLNACFDHRAEIYVPELGASFRVEQQSTRFFACQNPVGEGGGRKCLPRSFLNRFTQVYIDPLTTFDLLFIVRSAYPQLPETLITSMVEFNQQVCF